MVTSFSVLLNYIYKVTYDLYLFLSFELCKFVIFYFSKFDFVINFLVAMKHMNAILSEVGRLDGTRLYS